MVKLFIDNGFIESLSIEQRIFGPNEKELVLKILGVKETEYINNYPYHLLVYLNSVAFLPIIKIAAYEIAGLQKLNLDSFKQCLKMLPTINYDKLLFLTAIYPISRRQQFCDLINDDHKHIKLPELDDFLASSFGYLIYAHQLEQLYCMLTGCNYMEAITFRKDWNLKRTKARERAKEISVSSGFYLSDLIQQRAIEKNQFVYNANFCGAYNLWAYFINNTENRES